MQKKRILLIVFAVLLLLVAGACAAYLYWRGAQLGGDLGVRRNSAGLQDAAAAQPSATAQTQPDAMGAQRTLTVDGVTADAAYTRSAPSTFGAGSAYTALEGVVTFRGNHYRDGGAFGTPNITAGQFGKNHWSFETGSMPKSDLTEDKGSSEWSGSGWTGQPTLVRWDDATRQIMNLYPEKKAKQGLVEVIYATMDGHIYFLDLEDGSKTRDAISLGFPFKGAGSLDPRGIPLFYVGAGDAMGDGTGEGASRAFIVSLVDGSILYEFGMEDAQATRVFTAFDSSALVDANTDTLYYPSENGVLYSMKLNTQFDAAAGTLSIAPSEVTKFSYTTQRTRDNQAGEVQSLEDTFWLGMEDSAVFWENYLFLTDNAGNAMCIDANTMQFVWMQDILDDTNATPAFEVEANGDKVLYTAPSLHWQQEGGKGQVSFSKLNAMTGAYIWQHDFEVMTVSGTSGGMQATPVVGKGEIADLVIVPVARTPFKREGLLVAMDKQTGETRWTFPMKHYAWSSPVAVYAQDGTAYLVQCDSGGSMFLLDAKTGKQLDRIDLGANVEATPAVFGDTVVVGTRGKKIVGVKIQ